MFAALGGFAARFRYLILVVWIAAAAVITIVAPNIDEVASSDQATYLPGDAPFAQANKVAAEAFPSNSSAGSTVIVVDAKDAGGVTIEGSPSPHLADTAAIRFLAALEAWLNSPAAPSNIEVVNGPTGSAEMASMMISPDNRIALVQVGFSTSNVKSETTQAMRAITDWMTENQPAGIKTYQTGEGPIANATYDSMMNSIGRTIVITLILVLAILLFIYRSPVSPLIPLLTVSVAYLISRGIVGYLGANVMTVTSFCSIFMIVVLYGAGTDYCMFLISRFREEVTGNSSIIEAVARTVHRVGEPITSSAATVFVGFMAMIFAETGLFSTTGPSLAISIAVVLLAGLTFTPALLAVLGRHAFWPGKASDRPKGRFFEYIAEKVSMRHLTTVLAILVVLLPVGVYGMLQKTSYDMLGDLPDTSPVVVGSRITAESMGAGVVSPLNVVLTKRDPAAIATEMQQLTSDLAAIDGIADVRSLLAPAGLADNALGEEIKRFVRVDTQLELVAQLLTSTQISAMQNPTQALSAVSAFQGYLSTIAAAFPQVANDPDLLAAQAVLKNPLQLATQKDTLASALAKLASRFKAGQEQGIDEPYLLPVQLVDLISAFPEAGASDEMTGLKQLFDTYVAQGGTAYRLDVVLTDPATEYKAMDTVVELRNVLAKYKGNGEAVAAGWPAMCSDLRQTMDRDMMRTIGFVLAGIFVVLFLMLRSVVAPIYLIASVLLAYGVALGLSNVVFRLWFSVEGLTWYVPVFGFVILVAVAADYSIFLVGRMKEEVPKFGLRVGVHRAVVASGGTILSAGIILAGTFAALTAGEIKGLTEAGFAVAVGVLIYTAIIMPMLVPAITILLGKWAWWPGQMHLPRASTVDTAGFDEGLNGDQAGQGTAGEAD